MKNKFLLKFRTKIIFYPLIYYHPYNIRLKMIFYFLFFFCVQNEIFLKI